MEATGARRSKLDFTDPSPVFSSSKLPLMSTPALPRLVTLLLPIPLLLCAGRVGDSGSPLDELADNEGALLEVETLRNAFFQSEPASAPEVFLAEAGGGGGGGRLRLFIALEALATPPSSAEPTRLARPPPCSTSLLFANQPLCGCGSGNKKSVQPRVKERKGSRCSRGQEVHKNKRELT